MTEDNGGYGAIVGGCLIVVGLIGYVALIILASLGVL